MFFLPWVASAWRNGMHPSSGRRLAAQCETSWGQRNSGPGRLPDPESSCFPNSLAVVRAANRVDYWVEAYRDFPWIALPITSLPKGIRMRTQTLLAAAVLLLAPLAQAADLAKIERKIAREPAYQTKTPKYCLLAFGLDAKTRAAGLCRTATRSTWTATATAI